MTTVSRKTNSLLNIGLLIGSVELLKRTPRPLSIPLLAFVLAVGATFVMLVLACVELIFEHAGIIDVALIALIGWKIRKDFYRGWVGL